jgi:hypothetical protein
VSLPEQCASTVGAKAPRDPRILLPGSMSIPPPPPENKDAKTTPQDVEPASGEDQDLQEESSYEGSGEGNNESITDYGITEEEEDNKAKKVRSIGVVVATVSVSFSL